MVSADVSALLAYMSVVCMSAEPADVAEVLREFGIDAEAEDDDNEEDGECELAPDAEPDISIGGGVD